MKKTGPAMWVIGPLVVILGAYALCLAIRTGRSWRAETEPRPQVEPRHSEPAETHPREQTKLSEITPEDEEFLLWLDEEIAKEEEAHAAVEKDTSQEGLDAAVGEQEDAFIEQPWRIAQSVGDWRAVWADLNLTEEEQARLREGFRLAWERWQNMPEQERQAEIERLRAMRERWEAMSQEEKRQASQRMRDRFEQWRQSGEVELPQLSLD